MPLGDGQIIDILKRQTSKGVFKDDNESLDEASSTISSEYGSACDSSYCSKDEIGVALCLVDTKDSDEEDRVAVLDVEEKDFTGSCEEMEELVEPKVELSQNQELVVEMQSSNLSCGNEVDVIDAKSDISSFESDNEADLNCVKIDADMCIMKDMGAIMDTFKSKSMHEVEVEGLASGQDGLDAFDVDDFCDKDADVDLEVKVVAIMAKAGESVEALMDDEDISQDMFFDVCMEAKKVTLGYFQPYSAPFLLCMSEEAESLSFQPCKDAFEEHDQICWDYDDTFFGSTLQRWQFDPGGLQFEMKNFMKQETFAFEPGGGHVWSPSAQTFSRFPFDPGGW